MRGHTEEKSLEIELLGNCGVFWYQLSADVEAFNLHLVTTTYGENAIVEGKAECWTVVITMVHIIWQDLRNVQLETEPAYCSSTTVVMVGQYLWRSLQAHRVMVWMILCGPNSASIWRWPQTSIFICLSTGPHEWKLLH